MSQPIENLLSLTEQRLSAERRLLDEVLHELNIEYTNTGNSWIFDAKHNETITNLVQQLWQQSL